MKRTYTKPKVFKTALILQAVIAAVPGNSGFNP